MEKNNKIENKRNLETKPELWKRKEECCGCTACYAICPKNAINMVEDEEGFLYPKIDYEKCIGCKMCLNVCPIKKAKRLHEENK